MEHVTGDQEKPKKVHFEDAFGPTTPPPLPPPREDDPAVKDEEVAQNHDTEDKVEIPIPEENASPPPAPVKEIAYAAVKKDIEGSTDRDLLFAQIEKEKRLALIRAWEESEKSKAENKAYRRISAVESWENTKKSSVEAELRKLEEKYERKKAEYAEKMNNKVVGIHKLGAEKKAFIEAKQKEQFLKVEETSAKFRASGYTPKKLLLGCFVCPHSAII